MNPILDRTAPYPAVVVGIGAAALMTLYEAVKTLLFPEMSLWESHAVTIGFSTTIAVLAALAILRRRSDYEARLEKELREKETLLKEVHHRVKNNFQMIESIVSLEISAQDDERVRTPLVEMQNRILSMAAVHDMLYRGKDIGCVSAASLLGDLATLIVANFGDRGRGVELAIRSEELDLPFDQAIPCALATSELVGNCLKHAFRGSPRPPSLAMSFGPSAGGTAVLELRDNGVGLDERKLATSATLGVQLVRLLAEQLGGKASWRNDGGAVARFEFPLHPKKED